MTRHGFGYSVFEHTEGGIHSELWIYVALDAPVKFSVLKVRNGSGPRAPAVGHRLLRVGARRPARRSPRMHVVTEIDAASGALFARNPYNSEFAGRVAFFDVDDRAHGDRRSHRVPRPQRHARATPTAMTRSRLSGRVGAALDPCGAIQVPIELADGRGARDRLPPRRRARPASRRARSRSGCATPARRAAALEDVRKYWNRTLGAVQVETPDRVERARQRLAALPDARLPLLGAQRLLPVRRRVRLPRPAAGRDGAGPRRAAARCASTCCAARRSSSPRATCSTGGIRRSGAACARAAPTTTCGCRSPRAATSRRPATPACSTRACTSSRAARSSPTRNRTTTCRGVPARPRASTSTACARSRTGCAFGEHGLPLMGSGDWNDGMNLVGNHGKGESVWLGVLPVRRAARVRRLARAARRYRVRRALPSARPQELRRNIEQHAWDGDWYRRAWFDDGAPLGSAATPSADRLDPAELVGAVGRRRRRALAQAMDARRRAAGAPRHGPDPAARSAVRQVGAESGLHQGLRAGRARERRPVHARRRVGGDGVRRARRRRARLGAAATDQPGPPRATPPRPSAATRSSPTSSRPTSTPSRRTPAAAAGPGTRARRAGCTG